MRSAVTASLHMDTLQGDMDIWFKVRAQPEDVALVFEGLGRKKLLATLEITLSRPSIDDILKQIVSWGVEGYYYVGFSHDMNYIRIFGEETNIKTLYSVMPNAVMTED